MQLPNLNKPNSLIYKLCFICVVLASSCLIISKQYVAADVGLFRVLIETKLGLVCYLLIGLAGYLVLFSNLGHRLTENKWFIPLLIIVLIVFAGALTFIGRLKSIAWSTDNANALEVWIQALFSGKFPYEAVTNLGNLPSPFPFLPIYSIPFNLMGDVAFQNILNICILIYLIYKLAPDKEHYKFGLMALLFSMPLYVFLITRSDQCTVSVFILLGLYLFYKNRYTFGSIVFGCLIASKGYVWVIIPMTLLYLYFKAGYRQLIKSALIYALVAAIFILPFLIWNPHAFLTQAPLGVASGDLIREIEGIPNRIGINLPSYFSYVITGITMLFSLWSMWKTKDLFITFFLTYIFFGLFLFFRVNFLMTLSATTLGMMAISERYRRYYWSLGFGFLVIVLVIVKSIYFGMSG